MNGKAKKAAAPRKKANGYKMPAPIPIGEVITDTIGKKKWRIGPSIGVGGFGEIYSACEHDSSPKKGAYYPYVIKIEPHENGPLFVEKHFYLRNANKDDIAKFMKTKKLSTFGMPLYYGNGSHDYKGEKYRYLVLERYGKDLWSLFLESGRTFPAPTVFQIGLQMLDVLEYIHGKGYVHADIKGANILLGLKKGTENQTYLVDFGLATRVNEKEFKPDPKCAHNGTIEYTSRDAHLGVATMRGDLEILGYNMVQWLAGALPWERVLKQPKAVQDQKEAFMKNVRIEARKLPNIPEALIKFLEYINTLKPKDPVDYAKCRQLFESYLKSEGKTKTSKLEFTTKKQKVGKAVIKVDDTEDSTDSPKVVKKKKSKDDNQTKPKRGRKAKEDELTIDNEDVSSVKKVRNAKAKETEPIINNEEVNDAKKGRKAKAKVEPTIDSEEVNDECENEEPDYSIEMVPRKPRKRRSVEPSVVVNVKKTKMAPKATPPAKNNHAHTATQTSGGRTRRSPRRSPRQVSFDSPICEVLGARPDQKASPNTSADIFEDSFVEDKKVKKKRRLLAAREVTVKRTVIKKVTTTTVKPKARSYKDCPTIVNGRSPPK